MSLITADKRSLAVQRVAAEFDIDTIVNADARHIGVIYARLAQELVNRLPDGRQTVKALKALHEARGQTLLAILEKDDAI
jgi:hypothetical protein